MARVLCETQGWGWYSDKFGNGIANKTVTITGTIMTAEVGGSVVSPIITNANGIIPGWIEEGTYDLTIDGVTRQIEAVSGTGGGGDNLGFYNALDFSVINDGITDTTTAIEAFYNAIPAGSIAYFPTGIYIGLHDPDKSITILGDGRHATEFRPPGSVAANSKLVDFGSSTKCALLGVKLNGLSNANLVRGVNNEGNGTDKYLVVADCQFVDFRATTGLAPHGGGAAGIYVWTADHVVVERNEFIDCVFAQVIDNPGPDCRVVNNRVWSPASIMRGGIVLRRSSSAYSGSLVEGNTVENALIDSGGVGVDGHCIDLIKVIGVRVLGNTTRDSLTAGVHVGGGSYGCIISGNEMSEHGQLNGAALYIELNIGGTDAVGLNLLSGRDNGCIATENYIHDNDKYGVSLSFSAASVLSNNVIRDNIFEGIFCDSDYCVISGNSVANSYNTNLAAAPTSTPNVQAQIRVTTGDHCIISNNVVTDNQATVTADYGIAVADNSHVVVDNQAVGVTAPIFEQNGGPTNLVSDNMGYVTKNGGSASVANGATINHGLAKTPTRVSADGTVAGRIVNITAVSSTTLTISLTDAAGVAVGVAEPVRWIAEA